MSKVRFGLALAVALAAVLLFAGFMNASAANSKILKIACIAPQGNSGYKAIDDAGKEIEQTTQGRVKIQIYPGGVMGNDAAILRKMKVGQLHGSTFSAGGISEEYRDFQILSLPMLFRNYEEVDHVRPQIFPFLAQNLEARGYIPMAITEVGFAYMMSNTPIRSLGDLVGKKIWIPEADPISDTVFKMMGVPPTPRPISDVLTGLQTGMINTFANSPIGAIALQWYTKVKYMTDAPLVYTYGSVVFSKASLADLSDADRAAVRDIMGRHLTAWDQSTRQENAKALATLKKQGIKMAEVAPADLAAMEEVCRKATQDLVARNMFSADLLKRIQDLLAAYRGSKGN
jgi:TRAP-type C4-dicarboxylate transport system substrate-binding protein